MRNARILNIAVLALFVLVTASLMCLTLLCPESPVAFATGKPPKVEKMWSAAMSGIKWAGFASGSGFFAVLDRGGTLHVFSAKGGKRYSFLEKGVNRLVLSPDGRFAVAYSHLNPVNSDLIFLDGGGKRVWEMEVEGAVWSADAANTDAGARFVVGTGSRYVYVIEIGEKTRKYKRWKTAGAVVSLDLDKTGEVVTTGTWQDSAVCRHSLSGKKLWETAAESTCLQYAQPLAVSDRILVRSVPNRSGGAKEFVLLNGDGRSVWRNKPNSASESKLLCSPNGRYACLGYSKEISHKGKSTRERHAVLYENGKKLWDKGSLFLDAEPLTVTSQGHALICRENRTICSLGTSGDLAVSLQLAADLDYSLPSEDGRTLLAHCGDGKLYVLSVSQ